MKHILIALSLFLCTGKAFSQCPEAPAFASSPKTHDIPAAFAGESAVLIRDSRFVEYKIEKKDVVIYRTVHRIIKVLNDEGVEAFNKLSISYGGSTTIEQLAARTILADGRVIPVPRDKMKQTKDEDGDMAYAFAMEGVEKGSEIEYIFTEKSPFSLFGSEVLQFNIPILRAEFGLITPENYHFEIKTYNGTPAILDTSNGTRNCHGVQAHNVAALDEEPFSDYAANQFKVHYRLSYTDGENAKVRLFTWNGLAKQLYDEYYVYTDREIKQVERYLKSIGITGQDSPDSRIRKIEQTLKSTIIMNDELTDPSYLEFPRILETKTTTEKGFIRLFMACLTVSGIDVQLGLTTNRFKQPLDEQFENWRQLELYLMYLPKQNKYLAPSAIFYRMPYVPQAAIGNKGVFCKKVTLGDATSAVASVREVPAIPAEHSGSDIKAEVSFAGDMTPEIAISHLFSGYSALGIREAFVYAPKEREPELVKDLVAVASQAGDIKSYKLDNIGFENYFDNKPLEISAKVSSPQLLEKAGDKYLFKLGDVIGRQSEMYQEKERKLPIDLAFPHSLDRQITVRIPQGYKVTNPEAVRFDVVHRPQDGTRSMGFVSDYKMEGDAMVITITEYYNLLHYPKSEIGNFRKVINAAADFNKVVLVLEKS